MSAKNEIWQVMIQGEIFEADIEGLKQWVVEGRVLPTDKVRKGNLNWIQADRAPAMRPIFLGEELSPQHPASETIAWQMPQPDSATPPDHGPVVEPLEASAADPWTPTAAGAVVPCCHYHPQSSPTHICRMCGATFCQECPKFVGTSKIPLCPLCGDLCQPYEKLLEKSQRQAYQRSGFGLEDFGRAIRYPLKNLFSLLAAAMFYGLLLLAGFRGKVIAFMIMFGCISLVINKVSSGKMDRDFMPDLSSFSWWDDVLMPCALGIGITIVTWGPTILLVLAIWFGLLSGPGSVSLSPAQMQNEQEQSQLTPEDFQEIVNGTDAKKSEEAANKVNQLHPAQQISDAAENSKDGANSSLDFIRQFVYASVIVILLLLLTLGWAIFYYPMALAVAGYTEDFKSVINPLVGLDTIRRMGLVYVKAFLMYLGVEIVGIILSTIIYMVMAPFDLPFVGNLPATFLDGMLTFYINLVIACILGLALYKCADKLGIPTD